MGNRIRQLKYVRSCGYFIGIFWFSTGHFGSLHQSNLDTLVKLSWLVLMPSAYLVEHFTHSARELYNLASSYFLGRVGYCAAWEQCREQERAARVHNLADLLWSCRSMLHNALSSLSTDPDQIVHEQKTNIRGGRSSATSLCTCTSEQLYTPADQTPSCRFSAQIQSQSCSADRH